MSANEAFLAGAGPLSFTFWISSTVSIVTNVFGDARNNATVTIYNGSLPIWSGTMTQASPTITIPFDLYLGAVIINKGMTFNLTIPTQMQPGSVVMSGMVTTPPNPPQPFSAQIASWPLTSATMAFAKSGGSKGGSKKGGGKKS